MLNAVTLMLVLAGSSAQSPAQAPAAQRILMLRSGRAMPVRDWQVKGNMVSITGIDGQPLIMRLEQVDLSASDDLTRKHQEKTEAEAKAQADADAQAREAALKRDEQEARRAERLRRSREKVRESGGSVSSMGSAAAAPMERRPSRSRGEPLQCLFMHGFDGKARATQSADVVRIDWTATLGNGCGRNLTAGVLFQAVGSNGVVLGEDSIVLAVANGKRETVKGSFFMRKDLAADLARFEALALGI